MTCVRAAVTALIFSLGFVDQAVAAQPPAPAKTSRLRLGRLERIELPPYAPPDAQQADRVRALIRRLADLAEPDIGFSSTLSGDAFAPIPDSARAGTFVLTDHQLESSAVLTSLVELGPRALPFLLEALDDKTPTKLVISHQSDLGSMWFGRELSGNPLNERERQAIAALGQPALHPGESIDRYTVTIGDVCFVALGQIVSRPYSAVRYQPTACVVLNSPTHDPELAKRVRGIWTSDHPAQHLLDSLLLDYASQGIFNGDSLDGWDLGSDLQTAAAMRLLYYFPEQAGMLIAARLDALDVSSTGDDLQRWMKQTVANGVRADEFIRAVAWSPMPPVRRTVRAIFARSDASEIVRACLPALDANSDPSVVKRLEAMLERLPAEEGGPFGEGFHLLVALGQSAAESARPVFERYMADRSVQHCRTMCHVLRRVHPEWAVSILEPLLTDVRLADGWTYPVVHGQDEPREAIRLCDEAAETIHLANPDLLFEMVGEHADLDRQIQAMREAIGRRRPD